MSPLQRNLKELRAFNLKRAEGWSVARVADHLWDVMCEDISA
jgi:hypothetical protein